MRPIIGVDIGGTKIKVGLVDLKGKIRSRKEIQVTGKQKKDLFNLINMIESLNSKEVGGIGIGVPGFLDSKREEIEKLPNLKGWENFKLKDFLEKTFRKKTRIENDGNCVAIAERRFGNGRKYENFITLNIGTGLGGGIIINGELYRGKGNAGEFGHIRIGGNVVCGCGKKGCFETLVSGRAIERLARAKRIFGNSREIYLKAKGGNKEAMSIFSEAGRNLGKGLENLYYLFDPEIVLIGGGVSKAGNLLIDPARSYLKSRPKRTNLRINKARLENDAGIIGAASLLM